MTKKTQALTIIDHDQQGSRALVTKAKPAADTYTLQEIEVIGRAFKESRMFPDINTEAQALVKILAGKEMGIAPFASMSGIHIIKGKATIGANLMAALIKDSGRYDYQVIEHTKEVCRIQFYELGKECGVSEFSIKDAADAKLTGNEMWQKYTKNMLFARAISNGLRWYAPNATNGQTVYTPEELGAEVDEDGDYVQGSHNRSPKTQPRTVNTTLTQEPPKNPGKDKTPVEQPPRGNDTRESNQANIDLVNEFRAEAIAQAKDLYNADVDNKWVNHHITTAAKSLNKSARNIPYMTNDECMEVLQEATMVISDVFTTMEREALAKKAEADGDRQEPAEAVDAEPITPPTENTDAKDLWADAAPVTIDSEASADTPKEEVK